MITELRTLIAVARHGTFAAAGARIGLTQAAVSGHMRRLEEALGFALFERTGRSAVLNAAGLRTLSRAEELVARFDALGEPAHDEEWQGTLRIGAIVSVQASLLARALVPFRARFPLGRIHVSPGVSLHLMDRVDAGDLDLAILIRPPFDLPKDLHWQPLFHEDYALLVPAEATGDDWRALIAAHPFVRYDRGSFGGRQVERFLRDEAIEIRDWLEIDDIHAMAAMVARGLGIAIVPLTEMILPLPAGTRELPLGPRPLQREIGALYRGTAASPALSALIECLSQHSAAGA